MQINNKMDTSNVDFGKNDWSASNPGKITMYTGDSDEYSSEEFMIVSAHELGHSLGLADGYRGEPTKMYNSIMCDEFGYRNGTSNASNLDIRKVLKAFETKKAQGWE